MRRESGRLAAVLLVGALAGCGGTTTGWIDGYLESRRPNGPARPVAAAAVAVDTDKPIGADAGEPALLTVLAQASAAQQIASGGTPPATQPAAGREYVPWRQRRGPAYPDDFWTSFGRDAKEMPATLLDDTKASFTNPWSLAGLALAGASGIALAASDADDDVARHFRRNRSQLNTFWDSVGDAGGHPGTHFAFAGAMYFTTLAAKDVKNYEVSKTLLNALIINGLLTEALKGAARTRSPNGDPWGWPSGHASSSFALATVLGEAYGPWVGVPLFLGAAYVGYERVDARNHDFSDVISGAFIGMAIGHAVMQNHRPKVFGFEVVPWADPSRNSVGVAMVKRF